MNLQMQNPGTRPGLTFASTTPFLVVELRGFEPLTF